MDNNKKLVIIRLVIFYILAFLPLLIITVIQANKYGMDVWVSTDPDARFSVSITGMLGMLLPAVAHLITRLLTREGFKDTYLGWTAKKGNIRYYVVSVLLKPVEGFFGVFLLWKVFFGDMAFADFFAGDQGALRTSYLLMQLSMSVIIFFPAFGEEWGWRGYMMPKLMQLMPKPAAIVTGGILWGLWHAPLTVTGHNFGVDYFGFPWLGILLMCVFCILMNAVLTFLTERTQSIYPASFCHMINNNFSAGILASLLASDKALERMQNAELPPFKMFCVIMSISVITGIVCFLLLCRKKKTA